MNSKTIASIITELVQEDMQKYDGLDRHDLGNELNKRLMICDYYEDQGVGRQIYSNEYLLEAVAHPDDCIEDHMRYGLVKLDLYIKGLSK